MMCADREVQLNEYVDGALVGAERAALETHLAECAGCRETVVALRELVAGAAALPKSIEPRRDLWTPIGVRIGQRATGNMRRLLYGALAAAAALVLAFGVYRLLPPSTDLYRPGRGGGGAWAEVQADYERATDALSQTLAVERARLSPATVRVLERNLAIIDAAIRESREALARDTGSAEVRQLLAAAYQEKVDLLRWMAWAATSS